MAAGAGFKTFNTGDVLSAADVNTYLMQGVWVFASAAARDAAVTSPQEGNFAYLKDTNVTTYYTGSAWANLDTTGMTNPMTTTGDTIYSSSGSTPARLGIGTTGQVLTVAGGVPSWATPASGGTANWSLLNTGGTALTGGATVTVSGISGKDKIMVLVDLAGCTAGSGLISFRLNTDTGSNYYRWGAQLYIPSTYLTSNFSRTSGNSTGINMADLPGGSNLGKAVGTLLLSGCNSSGVKMYTAIGACDAGSNNGQTHNYLQGYYDSSSTISSVSLFYNNGNFNSGTMYVYTSA